MISPKTAAARLGISVDRVRKIIASGALKAEDIGLDHPVWAIDEAELERFAALDRPAHRPRKEPTMNGQKIYRITEGDYTPTGRWDEYPHLMDYKHAANSAAQKIRETKTIEDLDQLLRGGLTIWGGSLEIVTTQGDRVTYDRDCEPAEGAYIATALSRAIQERRTRS